MFKNNNVREEKVNEIKPLDGRSLNDGDGNNNNIVNPLDALRNSPGLFFDFLKC